MSFVVMALWNWLMPALFGLKTIRFLQALGLLVFSRILFGGFRGGIGFRGGRGFRRGSGRHGHRPAAPANGGSVSEVKTAP